MKTEASELMKKLGPGGCLAVYMGVVLGGFVIFIVLEELIHYFKGNK